MDKSFIVNALRKNGVQEGMCLEVHSSLKSFGYVEGGAETVISALKESVGSEGTIFMPALRLSPALPLTDEDKKLGITYKIKILPDDRKKAQWELSPTLSGFKTELLQEAESCRFQAGENTRMKL